MIHQVKNMRNNKLKTMRYKWSQSKFFIGKNRVLSKALGGTQEEEYAWPSTDSIIGMVTRYVSKKYVWPFSCQMGISRCLRNECGLLATNQSKEEVIL